MQKDFDAWNKNKKDLEKASTLRYAYPREIWWCSLGINLGAEIDGKNENFERPIIVMKVYNKETMIILPLTTKQKDDEFHHKIETEDRVVWAKLTQMRVISNKRLSRKVGVLEEIAFDVLKKTWIRSL